MTKRTLNAIAAVAVVICLLVVGYFGATAIGYAPLQSLIPNTSSRRIVTVDIVRILNSERAVAARMLGQQSTDAATKLSYASSQVRETIKRIAGPNTLVLVKQAVVATNGRPVRDITEAVLDRLGLPADVASIGTVGSTTRSTGYGNSALYQSLQNNYQQDKAQSRHWVNQAKSQLTNNLVP